MNSSMSDICSPMSVDRAAVDRDWTVKRIPLRFSWSSEWSVRQNRRRKVWLLVGTFHARFKRHYNARESFCVPKSDLSDTA